MTHVVLNVVRCFFTISKEDDWRCTNLHIYIKIGNILNKVIIDGGSCMNVVSGGVVTLMNLKLEPHPQPYKVARVNNTSMLVTERCLVPIRTTYGATFFL
ncbi:hypothetical protein CFOL_v3_24977 [Cephalotus follicularis]|uniref:RVP_2 domain-containing protein n=1 Tax=Cephalotus follicularis TaxID=3775 RepID=A0A1Q3CN27_CEPFO|nr:hypothetical protein CFOL_v3_24977 [Cephalotus follicularis]